MKLYTYPQAPSPRRIHLFLAEKGMEVDQEVVDIRAGEHFKPEFGAINPACTVPALVLDDGTCLSQSSAICDYLESAQPEPPLIGSDARQRAIVIDRNGWVEFNGLMAVMDAFRNSAPGMADHALTGARPVAQIAELAERGRQRYQWFLEDLDAWLGGNRFVAGESFSMADITALVVIDFARWGIKQTIPDRMPHLADWYQRVSSRPALAASRSS